MGIKYRLKFYKVQRMKFIGHLDLLKIFQRGIKRAGLPISYSQGFNPHQKISFALPLPIGMESLGEYVDLEMETILEEETICAALNETMPMGLTILSARRLEEGEKSGAALTEAAAYEIQMDRSGQWADLKILLAKVLEEKEIFIQKKTKSGTANTDVRPEIFSLALEEEGKVLARLSAGNQKNLKPTDLARLLCEKEGILFDPYKIRCLRLDLLKRQGEEWVGL